MARLINAASGNTIQEIKNPITWLFRHDRTVASFIVKPLQDGGGSLIANLDNNRYLVMHWLDYSVMMDSLLNSRAWRNHFGGTAVYRPDSNGNFTTTYTI